MPKYRLLADHYIQDRILPAGTEIGDGTSYPFAGEPTPQMEGMDDESRGLIERKFSALRGGVEGLDINGNPPKGGESSDGLIPMVGEEQPRPGFGGDNPLIPATGPNTAQPMPPYAVEQEFGSAVTKPDFSLTPEERQQAADATAQAAAPVQTTDVAPPEGRQEEAEPVEAAPVIPTAPAPTVSGKSIDSILKS